MKPRQTSPKAGLLLRFGRDLALYLPSKIVPGLVGLASIPIFTRLLSREEYGQVSLIEATVTLGVVLLAWTRVSMIRFVPACEGREAELLVRTALRVQLLSIGLIALGVGTFERLVGDGPALLAICAIALFAVRGLFRYLTQLLRARLEPAAFSAALSWMAVAGLLAGAFLAGFLEMGAPGVVLGAAIGGLSALPFLWKRALRGVRIIGPISLQALRRMAAYGLPLAMGLLGAWALRRLDRYQIEVFYGTAQVGLYTAAYAVAQHSVLVLAASFKLSSHPLLATIWETEGNDAGRQFLTQVTRVYLIVSLPIVVGLSLLARPIMQLLTQPEFAAGYVVVPWVAGGAFFFGLQEFFSQTLTMVQRTRLVMLSMLAAAASNALLNWWALPRFGYEAAAVTTLAAYALLCVLVGSAARSYCHWRFPALSLGRVLVAAASMAAVVIPLRGITNGLGPAIEVAIAVPAGAVVYGAMLLLLRETSLGEMKALLSIRKGGR